VQAHGIVTLVVYKTLPKIHIAKAVKTAESAHLLLWYIHGLSAWKAKLIDNERRFPLAAQVMLARCWVL
jgi:hypothetical protein